MGEKVPLVPILYRLLAVRPTPRLPASSYPEGGNDPSCFEGKSNQGRWGSISGLNITSKPKAIRPCGRPIWRWADAWCAREASLYMAVTCSLSRVSPLNLTDLHNLILPTLFSLPRGFILHSFSEVSIPNRQFICEWEDIPSLIPIFLSLGGEMSRQTSPNPSN